MGSSKARLAAACGAVVLGGLLMMGATESDAPGRKVFEEARCGLCHSVEAAGIEAKIRSEKLRGPGLPNGARGRALLEGYMLGKAEIEGRSHPKPFSGSPAELSQLVDWLDGLARVGN